MKISKKNIYIFLLILFGSLVLNIMIAKTNGIYSSRLIQYKLKIIPWEEVFQDWPFILYRTIGIVFIGYFFYFLLKKKKGGAANNAVKSKKGVK